MSDEMIGLYIHHTLIVRKLYTRLFDVLHIAIIMMRVQPRFRFIW